MNHYQFPILSPFGAASTARDIVAGLDLSGRIAVVTGGYSGIGLETTRALASAGATIIVPARDRPKAEAALRGLANATIEPLDLIDPISIDHFATNMLARHDRIDMLINNAGFIGFSLERDARSYETQFATNHLGHYQLTVRLWPALVKAQARVISVSSCGHAASPVMFDDIHFERRPFDAMAAYGQ